MFVASSSRSPPTPLLPPPSQNPTWPPPLLLHLRQQHHRRLLLLRLATSSISLVFLRNMPAAAARGLFQMPPARLSNRYFLVRAGESVYEGMGVLNTNPVTKTSVDNGLSLEGKRQAARAAIELQRLEACSGSCWIWPSITQRAYQAAEIIASVNGIDRSRIVPEYSFLDARGLGALEGRSLDAVSEVCAFDEISPNNKPPPITDGTPNESVSDVFVRVTQVMHWDLSFKPGEVRLVDLESIPTYKMPTSACVYSSDEISPNNKPPPITDGTPNESVSDVFVRVTQLMSILETQYSEQTIVIVSPDSDNLSILQAGLTGVDLRRHWDLSFKPGEVRLVEPESIPTYKMPASAVYKCMNPPTCT